MKKCTILFVMWIAFTPFSRADFLVRIGDIDGFGYQEAPGFLAANGKSANIDGQGVLGNGDFLPDINRDGALSTQSRDNFDFRSTAELANTSVTAGTGVISTQGTLGSKFTDISLARSYDASQAAGTVLVGGNPDTGLIFGAGGAFPSPPSSALPNQPGFVFLFEVDKAALNTSNAIYFNLIFGDYDVTPAHVQLTKADGSTSQISLRQQNSAVADGLIQAATATLNFNDVFTDGGSVWKGSLKVDFLAPNEPYTAFDFVELSTIPLVPVPEPTGFVTFGIGAAVLAGYIRARRS